MPRCVLARTVAIGSPNMMQTLFFGGLRFDRSSLHNYYCDCISYVVTKPAKDTAAIINMWRAPRLTTRFSNAHLLGFLFRKHFNSTKPARDTAAIFNMWRAPHLTKLVMHISMRMCLCLFLLALGAPLLLPSLLDKAPRQGDIQELTADRRIAI